MYQLFSDISNLFIDPFIKLAYRWEGIPYLYAFILGLVGALAPCQFTSNIGAITIYGNRSLQQKVPWMHVLLFILGKLVVFSGLGLIVWMIGKEFESHITLIVPYIRKAIGPILILIGIYLIGIFNLRWTFKIGKIPERFIKDSKIGSFLMGVSFTIAFCPTMFILFFVMLMPVVLSTSYGAFLPSIFGIGTSIPLLIVIFLIWYFELGGTFKKKGRRVGKIVQKIAGWILIIVGILDAITYW